ncbi:FAD-dependent thymidylate synthase [Trichlorobacter lovleyi]|jgi:thymidylate synthase (FAD) (EC 2.1.1.148)|uniref:Flavin-dependent thymidylate synthase n=1 Tax=Trichlorobacter lovleyi (strain ATCC BAA-1151 / DSM 17278 / SZ) TaxID=398767 RepID=B3E626_TRIL1|nr:FAD-dependent thymidylate synthase [Trichlorobacter lovleyi]ACD94750.1 thymidylate synthase, flavin-dependent [Trichlorobacter lovleyi SZ]
MNIELLHYTPEPERTVALAARLCYSPTGLNELKEKIGSGDIRQFIDKIMTLGHHSVLEHASFTFGVEGISRVTSHQLVRHRVASYSQQSQRYVSHVERFDAVLPPSIAANEEAKRIFDFTVGVVHQAYKQLVEMGLQPEDARYLLPNATETKIIITMNARELLHFFRLRCCERAQWEIRSMAVGMLKLAKQAAPTIFRDAGPGCVAGPCPEGEFCCGRTAQVRKQFRSLT